MKGNGITPPLEFLFPVGSIYISVNEVNPNTLFGGTWERIKDKFMLCSGDTYSNGSTGGEATHTLTMSEMPYHNHQGRIGYNQTGYGYTPSNWEAILGSYASPIVASGGSASTTYPNINAHNIAPTSYSGSSAAHNNMPPYLAVVVWKRVS